jgi:hypothetical protein
MPMDFPEHCLFGRRMNFVNPKLANAGGLQAFPAGFADGDRCAEEQL